LKEEMMKNVLNKFFIKKIDIFVGFCILEQCTQRGLGFENKTGLQNSTKLSIFYEKFILKYQHPIRRDREF